MRIISILAIMLLAAGVASTQVTPRTALDSVIDQATTQGFSGLVIVGDTEGPTYQRLLPSRQGEPSRMDELWRWASVTKQMTAIVVMQEVEKGTLALDKPITAYLPEFKGPTGGAVTLRQLLQHNSGLPNPDDEEAFYTQPSAAKADRTAALGYCAGPVKAQPGGGFSYNNCDYLVLGAILEAVTGQDYATLIQTRIAEPAGARSLKSFPATRQEAPETVGGEMGDGKPELAFNFATFGAGAALYGMPADLLKVDMAMLAGKYLSRESMTTLWTGDPALGFVALGVWAYPANLAGCGGEVQLVERRGQIGAVQVRNIIAPRLGRILIVFSNGPGPEFGEVWQGQGLTYDLLNAAFCTAAG